MIKKIISALCCVSVCVCLIASCKKDNANNQENITENEEISSTEDNGSSNEETSSKVRKSIYKNINTNRFLQVI